MELNVIAWLDDVATLVAGRTRDHAVGNRRVVGKQLMGTKLKKLDQQQLWAEAQRRCRLSGEAVRMAKELGIGPRSLIKNIPARTAVEVAGRGLGARSLRTAPAQGRAQESRHRRRRGWPMNKELLQKVPG